MSIEKLKHIVEAALLAAGRPLRVEDIMALFEDSGDAPDRKAVREALSALADDWEGRALELVEVSSGFRLQVRKDYSLWMGRLWAERPPRYSRALMETLALVAYRQPITRGEIEDVRGVSVSTNIVRTLLEREWIRVVGHREVPGRPALFGTTATFLNDFNLKALDELPPLAEIRDLDSIPDDLFAEGPALSLVPPAPADEESAADASDMSDPRVDRGGAGNAVPDQIGGAGDEETEEAEATAD
ncbi:MAG: SMC-Scp complex subunit ScpB [Gammaproteobacteria bacterium]|nr:SMC-Scp complex subunit ScpB [Gammaproteobacteria bacterium]